jgi:hypothetical protein
MSPGDRPFEGTRALTLMAKYSGVSPRERLYDLADFTNVVSEYPGAQPGSSKYDMFPLAEALKGRLRIYKQISVDRYERVVVLGSAASKVFGKTDRIPWFGQIAAASSLGTDRVQRYELYYSPHPGGTSMWWNDPRNRTVGTRFFTWLFQQQSSERRDVEALTVTDGRRIQL